MLNLIGLLIVFGASALVTGQVRRFALRTQQLDLPNERSSHTTPTPRGGGLGLVLVFLAGLSVLAVLDRVEPRIYAALAGGGVLVAVIGALDDRRGVPARVRLLVHAVAAAWALVWLRGGDVDAFTVVEWIGLIWMINLYNFMDGIDGIAGFEAIFVAGAGALLLWSGHPSLPAICLVLAAATAGFLLWNFPRARIFMGDVASGFLGFVIGGIAIASVQAGSSAHWPWLILIGVFGVDATLTLLRRVASGKRATDAHRTHAYQHASRRWGSHVVVTVAVFVINVAWLLPWAFVAASGWMFGPLAALIALLPLAGLAYAFNAGRD